MASLVPPGGEISRTRSPRRIPRHRHLAPYAALVLRGFYVEVGDHGRFRVEAGDVLFHDRFDAHSNAFGASGADILNLPWRGELPCVAARTRDLDAVARLAERDPTEAAVLLSRSLVPGPGPEADWPDLLAAALALGEVPSLSRWAADHGLDPSTVSRGFARAYGIPPKRFGAQRRACRAAQAIARGVPSLAMLAYELGFADQAHLSREVARLTGRSPRRLGLDLGRQAPARPSVPR